MGETNFKGGLPTGLHWGTAADTAIRPNTRCKGGFVGFLTEGGQM